MDLTDAITLIQETAVSASGAEGKLVTIHPAEEPAHVYLTVDAGGQYKRIEAAPKPRGHVLDTLEEAIRYAADTGTDKSVVWFDANGVIMLLDDDTRRDMARLTFNYSPQFAALRELEKSKAPLQQRDVRRLLKVTLDGATQDKRLLNFLEDVRWNNTANSGGVIKQQQEAFGRDVNQVVTGANGELCPEEIVFSVRVYDDPGLKDVWPVRCTVECLVKEQAFSVYPFPFEIQNALDKELTAIGERIRADVKWPIFRGKP